MTLTPNPTAKPRIFISYSRADDEPFVERLYHDLKDDFDVWWDRVSMPNRGLTFLQEIRDAINHADRLLLVAGPRAFTSDYVRDEWLYAYETYKGINIALRLGDYPDLPEQLSGFDAPDFRNDDDYDERLATLKRQLAEPVAPVGQFHNVPALPPHFLNRPEALDALRELVIADVDKPTLISAEKRTTAVEGMGGIGKSVMATAFAHDRKVRFAFPDGIVWLTAGHKPSMYELYRAVGVALGDNLSNYPDETTARQNAQKALAEKKCLLILDDVWELPVGRAFRDLISGTSARLLITTRNLQINDVLNANEYRLKLIDQSQAADYLRSWVGDDPDLETIAKKLGYLFLALKLAGARMKKDGLSGADYLRTFDRVSRMKIDRQASDREDSLEASITLSVDAAFANAEDEKLLYHTFGIFPEDAPIPQQTVMQLWRHLRPDVDEFDLLETLNALVDLALVERNADDRTITLHDLLHSYTREKLGDRYVQTHRDLLDSYEVDEWHQLSPDEPYLWSNLSLHFIASEQRHKLNFLLTREISWVYSKFNALGTYESVVSDIVLCLDSYIRNTPDEIIAAAKLWAVRHIIHEIVADHKTNRLRTMVLIDKNLETDGKRIKEALGYARLQPDPKDRFDCLFAIWEGLDFDVSYRDELEKIAKEIDEPQIQKRKLLQLDRAIVESANPPYTQQRMLFDGLDTTYDQQNISKTPFRDCVDKRAWDNAEFFPNLIRLVREISGEDFDSEIYETKEGYLQEIMENEGFNIVSELIQNNDVSEAVFLIERDEDFGELLNDPDELFEIAGLLAELGCQEGITIYEMAEDRLEKYDLKDIALYEISFLLVNLNEFAMAAECARLIQPNLFGDRDKILHFIEINRRGNQVIDKPDLAMRYNLQEVPQALARAQKGEFVGRNGAFNHLGLQRNLSEFLSQVTSWHIGLEIIESGLTIKVIQEIIRIMAWNDRSWLTVQEILESKAK